MRRLATAVTAALLLTGCASVVEGTASPGAVAAPNPEGDPLFEAPTVGTCHAIEVIYDPLDVPEVVDCGAGHTGETAVVVDTGLDLDAAYPTDADLDGDYLGEAYDDVCGYDVAREYLGGAYNEALYVDYTRVLPTEEQWAAGARWVACDVVYGYSDIEESPGRMAGALQSAETSPYRQCLAGSPQDDTVVACSTPHWGEVIIDSPLIPEGTPYPADQAARAPFAQECLPAAVDYLDGPLPEDLTVDITTDDEESWAGYPYATCAIVPVGGGETSSSVRDR